MATGELIVSPRGGEVSIAADFKPVFSVDEAIVRKKEINRFIHEVLVEGEDYGVIDKDSNKDGKARKVLLKPGAEKMSSIFALTPRYSLDDCIEDWSGAEHGGEPLFSYSYRCQLFRGDKFMGESVANCNSWESKYRYRWVREEFLPPSVDKTRIPSRGKKQKVFAYDFAIEKAETTGDYGKPESYWQAFRDAIAAGAPKLSKPLRNGKPGFGYEAMIDTTLYRIPNPDVADVINTCKKISQKRALVSAVLGTTNCSDAFTPDVEDFEEVKHAATVARQEGSGSISSGGELFDNDDDPGPSPPPPYISPQDTQKAATGARPSAHEKQREAVQAQFQASQAAPAPVSAAPILDGRPIPEELSVVFARIDKQEGEAVGQAFNLMDQSFKALSLASADAEYGDIKVKYRNQFPAGGRKKATGLDIKICLLDMWDCLQRWEKHQGVNRGGI